MKRSACACVMWWVEAVRVPVSKGKLKHQGAKPSAVTNNIGFN